MADEDKKVDNQEEDATTVEDILRDDEVDSAIKGEEHDSDETEIGSVHSYDPNDSEVDESKTYGSHTNHQSSVDEEVDSAVEDELEKEIEADEEDEDDEDDEDDDEDYEDDEEEEESLQDKILAFLEEKIPFLYDLYLKITKQNEDDDEEEEDEEDEEAEEEDDEEDEEESSGLKEQITLAINKVKKELPEKLPFLQKIPMFQAEEGEEGIAETSEVSSEDDEEEEGEGKQKKKALLPKPVMYGIFVMIIAWLLFDEGFVGKKKEEPTKPVPIKKIRPKKPKPQVKVKPVEKPPIEQPQVKVKPVVKPPVEQPPVEVKPIEESPVEVKPGEESSREEGDDDQSPVVVIPKDQPETDRPEEPSAAQPSTGQPAAAQPSIKKTPVEQVEKSSEMVDPNAGDGVKRTNETEIKKTKDLDTEIRDIIAKVEEKYADREDYETPPDYSKIGRGLVYNCKKKHWACINRVNYFQCRKNQIFFTKLKSPPECVVFDVYYSDEDCQVIQKEMIDKLVPVPACTGEDKVPSE